MGLQTGKAEMNERQACGFSSPPLISDELFTHRRTTMPWRRELIASFSSSEEQHELESSL
jgi:hypothetical protein